MNGRLEALITLASQTFAVDDGGGADTVTLTDGTYYWTDLLAHVEARIEAAVGTDFTVTASFGETGSGKITIAKNSGTFKLLFSSTAQANLFGVAAATDWNGAAAASFTSARGVMGVWLPQCGMDGPDLDFDIAGHLETDLRHTMGPTGVVSAWISTSSYRSFKGVRWVHVDRDHALDGVNAAVVSWSQFVRQSQWGGDSYFPISPAGLAPPVRVYYNADTSALLGSATGGDGVYSLVLKPSLRLARATEGWTGLWTVELTELVKV